MKKVLHVLGIIILIVFCYETRGMAADEDSLIVSDTGRVGIGTSNPAGRLDVVGSSGVPALNITGEDNIWFDDGQVRITTHDGYGNWEIKQGADNDDKYVGQGDGAIKLRLDENGYFQLYTAPAGTLGSSINWNLGLFQNSSGFVGIDTISPKGHLHVPGSYGFPAIYLTGGTDGIWFDDGQVRITTHDGYGNWQIKQGADTGDKYCGQGTGAIKLQLDEQGLFRLYSAPAGTLGSSISWNIGLAQDSAGRVGIGTTTPSEKLHVEGNIKCTGLLQESDIRWKENIEPLENALDIVTELRGVSYIWIDPSRGEGLQIGLIAQEVEQILPEVVHTDSQGYKSVEYAKLVAPLIEAVKALKHENESLKKELDTKVEALMDENQALKDSLKKILSRLDALEE